MGRELRGAGVPSGAGGPGNRHGPLRVRLVGAFGLRGLEPAKRQEALQRIRDGAVGRRFRGSRFRRKLQGHGPGSNKSYDDGGHPRGRPPSSRLTEPDSEPGRGAGFDGGFIAGGEFPVMQFNKCDERRISVRKGKFRLNKQGLEFSEFQALQLCAEGT